MFTVISTAVERLDKVLFSSQKAWAAVLGTFIVAEFLAFHRAIGSDWMTSGNDMAYLLPAARHAGWHDVIGWLDGPWIGVQLFDYYRPVTSLFLFAEYKLFGLHSAGWQCLSLGLHIGSTLLLATLSRRIFLSGVAGVAAAAAWGFRSLQFETIAWTPAQTDLLAGFFSLCCLVSLTAYFENAKSRWLVCAASCALLALGSKEAAFVLPLLASLLILRATTVPTVLRWRLFSGIWVFTLAFLAWRHHALGGMGFMPGQASSHSGGGSIQPAMILSNLRGFILPFPLNPLAEVGLAASFALFAGLLIIAALYRRRFSIFWIMLAALVCILLVTAILGGTEWWFIQETYFGLAAGVLSLGLITFAFRRRTKDSLFVLAWGICAFVPLYHIVWNVAGNVTYLADTYWGLAWGVVVAGLINRQSVSSAGTEIR